MATTETTIRSPSGRGPTLVVPPTPVAVAVPPRSHPTTGATLRDAFLEGARAMLPILIGVVPFGLVIGVTVAESGISHLGGWATGWMIYGGSAQLAVIELLDAGAAPLIVLTTVVAINARLLLYGSAMASHWRGTGRAWRGFASYLLVDPSFAVGTAGYERHRPAVAGHAHYLGGAVTLWVVWQLAIGVGVLAGSFVPEVLSLEFAVPLYLVGMVVPKATTRSVRLAVGVAAFAAVGGASLPFHAGLIVAITAGVAAGVLHEERSR